MRVKTNELLVRICFDSWACQYDEKKKEQRTVKDLLHRVELAQAVTRVVDLEEEVKNKSAQLQIQEDSAKKEAQQRKVELRKLEAQLMDKMMSKLEGHFLEALVGEAE